MLSHKNGSLDWHPGPSKLVKH